MGVRSPNGWNNACDAGLLVGSREADDGVSQMCGTPVAPGEGGDALVLPAEHSFDRRRFERSEFPGSSTFEPAGGVPKISLSAVRVATFATVFDPRYEEDETSW